MRHAIDRLRKKLKAILLPLTQKEQPISVIPRTPIRVQPTRDLEPYTAAYGAGAVAMNRCKPWRPQAFLVLSRKFYFLVLSTNLIKVIIILSHWQENEYFFLEIA